MPSAASDNFIQPLIAHYYAQICALRSNDPCECTGRLDDSELTALYLYTTDDPNYSFIRINSDLSKGVVEKSAVWPQIERIDVALENLRPYVGECYRSEKPGGRIHSKATALLKATGSPTPDDVTELTAEFFMSTSLNQALKLRGNAVEIVIIASHAGRFVGHISKFPKELEVLFKRKSRFLLTAVDKTATSIIIYLGEIL